MKNAGRYYGLLVIVQAVLLFGFFIVLALAPDDRRGVRARAAYSEINGGLKTALGMFDVDCGRYPTSKEGLNVLLSASADGSLTNWRGPYLDGLNSDPWGHEYVYRSPGVHNTNSYDLYSLGPDGVGNDSDDIGNWQMPQRLRIVDEEDLFAIFQLLPLGIPFLFVVRIIVGIFSSRFRIVVEENRLADWFWFAMAVFIVLVVVLVPKISGRAE